MIGLVAKAANAKTEKMTPTTVELIPSCFASSGNTGAGEVKDMLTRMIVAHRPTATSLGTMALTRVLESERIKCKTASRANFQHADAPSGVLVFNDEYS
jgi:hypothetical protein